MKKLIYTILAAAAVAFSVSSCSEDNYLHEEMVSVITQQYYETENGMDGLVLSLYMHARMICSFGSNYQGGAELWERLMDTGLNDQMLSSSWHKTGSTNISHRAFSISNWDFYGQLWGVYPACNDAMNVLSILENKGAELGGKYKDEAYLNKQKSIALFVRDWYLYILGAVEGEVYVPQEPTKKDTGIYYAPRMNAEQMWNMFIQDIEFAHKWLPSASEYSGTLRHEYLTKGAAAFFLAHLYLERALGNKYADKRNPDGTVKKGALDALGLLYKGGNYESDLASAVKWASEVINSSDYALESNYDVFGEQKLGDFTNELSKEIVWSFGANTGYMGEKGANDRFGWRIDHYYGRYTSAYWGVPSTVWTYGASKGYTGTADWGYDVFTNKINDSRFAKTFLLEMEPLKAGTAGTDIKQPSNWYLDPASNSAAFWRKNFNPLKTSKEFENQYAEWFNANKVSFFGEESPYAQRVTAISQGEKADYTTTSDLKINGGEISLVMIPNDREHAINADLCHSMPFIVAPRWCYYENADGTERRYFYLNQSYEAMNNSSKTSFTQAGRPFIKKYNDPDRLQIGGPYSGRNLNVFRLSDMYLLRAWAEGLQGNWQAAIDDINVIRARAAWKAGETRPMAIAQFADYYPYGDSLTKAETQYPYDVAVDNTDAMLIDASYWTPGNDKFDAERYPHYLTAPMKDDQGYTLDLYNMNANFSDPIEFYFSNFIINEYCRELQGEFAMMTLLSYSGLKYPRILWHTQRASVITFDENGDRIWPEADYNSPNLTAGATGKAQGGMQPYMIWSPFTVSYMNQLTDEEGNPLTDEVMETYQNPGY